METYRTEKIAAHFEALLDIDSNLGRDDSHVSAVEPLLLVDAQFSAEGVRTDGRNSSLLAIHSDEDEEECGYDRGGYHSANAGYHDYAHRSRHRSRTIRPKRMGGKAARGYLLARRTTAIASVSCQRYALLRTPGDEQTAVRCAVCLLLRLQLPRCAYKSVERR